MYIERVSNCLIAVSAGLANCHHIKLLTKHTHAHTHTGVLDTANSMRADVLGAQHAVEKHKATIANLKEQIKEGECGLCGCILRWVDKSSECACSGEAQGYKRAPDLCDHQLWACM